MKWEWPKVITGAQTKTKYTYLSTLGHGGTTYQGPYGVIFVTLPDFMEENRSFFIKSKKDK